jgi:hypothetical protein
LTEDINLGNIVELPLNELFEFEARDFTPWLQKNIEVVGNVIGMDIADAETEVPIGNYRLDILAYESGTDRRIAIENQYGSTNHTHLGQLITYMAGINAEVVVWIAENFNNEHITAINHLNQISNEDIAFFCIKPRLIKIGDSNPALEFLVVAKPDEWEKQVKSETPISPRQTEYKRFWTKLVNRFKETYPSLKPAVWSINRSYLIMCYGGTGLEYTLKFSHGSFLVNLYIKGNIRMDAHEIIDRLIAKKDYIENELGAEVEFDKKERVKATRVNLYCDAGDDILSISNEEKDFLIDWRVEWLPKFKKTLQNIIQEFD